MDAFSEILSGVKLSGAVFFTAEFSAPWGFSTPAPKSMAAKVAPGAAHLVIYHLLIDGGAVVELEGGRSVALMPGDVVIFPQGDPHHMSSGKGHVAPFPNYGITAKINARDLSPLRAGGGGAVSRFVCGYMTCDPHLSRPILDGLPPVFKVNIRTDPSGHWLESSIQHLVEESASGRVGSEAMLAKLSEALFVDTLRRYVAGLPEQQRGWLAGARDPIVGRSLGLLHSRVAHPWTIADLADEVGISRSALVERFTPVSLRAADDVSDPLAAAAGRAIAREDLARRRGHRHRDRIRIGSGFQSRIQARVRAAAGPISQRPQGFANPAERVAQDFSLLPATRTQV